MHVDNNKIITITAISLSLLSSVLTLPVLWDNVKSYQRLHSSYLRHHAITLHTGGRSPTLQIVP
jgi:hypothetical protein